MSRTSPLRGLLLFNFGLVLFACMDVTNKYLTASFDVPFIAAARYIGNVALMLALVAPRHGMALVRTERTALVWFRGGCLAVSSLLIGFALQRMPVAETSGIAFLAPILVVVGAGQFLGERVGARGWVAVLMGFVGVLLIVRPGSGLDATGVICALVAVVAIAVYQILSRLLASTERTMAMLFYTALAGAIPFGVMLPWFWADHVPTLLEGSLLAALGVLGGLGHFLFTAAFREAPASILAPMSYLQLVWSVLLGWLVFGQMPDAVGLTGIAIIGASGVMVALKSRRPVEELG